MRANQDVRDYARKLELAEDKAIEVGMAEKAMEFVEGGAEIYK